MCFLPLMSRLVHLYYTVQRFGFVHVDVPEARVQGATKATSDGRVSSVQEVSARNVRIAQAQSKAEEFEGLRVKVRRSTSPQEREQDDHRDTAPMHAEPWCGVLVLDVETNIECPKRYTLVVVIRAMRQRRARHARCKSLLERPKATVPPSESTFRLPLTRARRWRRAEAGCCLSWQ